MPNNVNESTNHARNSSEKIKLRLLALICVCKTFIIILLLWKDPSITLLLFKDNKGLVRYYKYIIVIFQYILIFSTMEFRGERVKAYVKYEMKNCDRDEKLLLNVPVQS